MARWIVVTQEELLVAADFLDERGFEAVAQFLRTLGGPNTRAVGIAEMSHFSRPPWQGNTGPWFSDVESGIVSGIGPVDGSFTIRGAAVDDMASVYPADDGPS